MQRISLWGQRFKLAFALIFLACPAGIFYFLLWQNAVNLPILDDYQVVLQSLSWISQHHSPSSRVLFLLTAEHNGYKLVFANAIVFAQYLLLGQAHFLFLVAFGNAFALGIFLVVVAMSHIAAASAAGRCMLLAPAAWLIFQLQYASALDFASISLQQLTVIFFALLSICLLAKPSKLAFSGSCAALILSIASSPNGFFAAPAGLLLLAQARRWKRLTCLAAVVAASLGIYLFRYVPDSTATGPGSSGGPLAHVNLVYALSFLGSSAARFASVGPSVVLGILLCGVFALAVRVGYFRRNPAVFYSMVFILINAIAVSGLRSDLGVSQSLASRYRTYSNLLLALSYFFMVESLLAGWGRERFAALRSSRVRRGLYVIALALSIAFCCASDVAGTRFLQGKKQALIYSYRVQWQGLSSAQAGINPAAANPALLRQIEAGVYKLNLAILRQAVQDGVYQPPRNP